METIRCTVCGSDDVEVKTFVKPNLDNHCSTTDFTDCLDNTDNCYCIECGDNTRLKYFTDDTGIFGDNTLYDLMVTRLQPSYIVEKQNEDAVYGLAHEEYLRVRKEVCLQYGFDEDRYIQHNGGQTPFDEYDEDVHQEVYRRMIDSRFALWQQGKCDAFIASINLIDKAGNTCNGADSILYDMEDIKDYFNEHRNSLDQTTLKTMDVRYELRKLDIPLTERKEYPGEQSIFDTYEYDKLPLIPLEKITVHDHVPDYWGDFVVCCNCGQYLLLPVGSEICPNCNKTGGLTWGDKQQESNADLLKSAGYEVKTGRQLAPEEYLTAETLKAEFGISQQAKT